MTAILAVLAAMAAILLPVSVLVDIVEDKERKLQEARNRQVFRDFIKRHDTAFFHDN